MTDSPERQLNHQEELFKEPREQVELSEDSALDRMSGEAGTRVIAFINEQEAAMQRIDAEAAQGESFGLSPKELALAKQETGIRAKLEALKEKAAEISKKFKKMVVDVKVKRVVKEASWAGSENINFQFIKLRQIIAALSPEQLARHPEIVERARKNIIQEFNLEAKRGYHSMGFTDSLDRIGVTLSAFQNHPEVTAGLLKSPEIYSLQKKIFLECLYDPHAHSHAVEMAQKLHLTLEQTKPLVIEAVRDTITRTRIDPNVRDHVYDYSRVIKDFGIDKETVRGLALDYFKTEATGTYPWSLDERFKERFHFSEQEFQDFVKDNRETLQALVYEGLIKKLKEILSARPVTSIFEHFQKYFYLDLNLNTFKKLPENSQVMREVVLGSAAKGTIIENEEGFESISSVPIVNILQTPEGQDALYRGIQSQIVEGKKREDIEKVINNFKLDIVNIRSSPQTLESLKTLLRNNISGYNGVWRSDLIEFLNIDEEEIGDIKIEAISTFVKQEKYHSAFLLMNSVSLNQEQIRNISKNIFGTEDKFGYLTTLRKLLENKPIPAAFTAFIKQHERFSNKTPEQLEAYVSISQKVVNSPSQEIIRIQDQLIEQILATENPEKTYEIINNIFIQNNLPLVGKVQRIFDALYPDSKISEMLYEKSSPVLKQAKSRIRKNIIFQDLLKVHIESGNRSLKFFLGALKDLEPLVEKLRQNVLSEQEREKLTYLFRKLKTVADVSLRGQQNEFSSVKGESLLEDYNTICSQLGVKVGQKVSERVVQMFARPLGYQNIDQILSQMQKSRALANARSRSSFASLVLEKGDLVKGVNMLYINNILQNGSVAKEFLGASSDSDATPFDTDLEILTAEGKPNFEESYEAIKIAKDFGELMLVIKDRGQFQKTSSFEPVKYDPSKYELFGSGAHYGIRTGFPCTEVDFMVFTGADRKQTENLFYSIAQNGYYIPVVDRKGKLLFPPEKYDQYRKVFLGVERFEGENIKFSSLDNDSLYSEVKSIIDTKEVDNERLVKLKREIRDLVTDVLKKYGVRLKSEYDDSLVGAELLDIGSTGRGTNAVGEGDFDFNLKLDAEDFDKIPKIAQEIITRLGAEMKEAPIYPSFDNNNQLRFFGSNRFSQKGLDIDIGFVRKSDLNVYASHDAIADKLNNIRQQYGTQAYNETVANILLAKKWLKEAGVYKKGNFGEGGLGGIGVENLILAYNGNVKEAFGAFYRAAQNPDGSFKNFETFVQDFKILDAGMNLRFNSHDNFVLNMNPGGYKTMLSLIKERLKLN
jgi:hypothetical protein